MAGVSASLDHGHVHSRLADPIQSVGCKRGTDAAVLILRVNGEHPDHAKAFLRVQLNRDETDGGPVNLGDPDVVLIGCEHSFNF